MLSDHTVRCEGVWSTPKGESICGKRDTCARYTQREKRGQFTPLASWLCPTPDEFFGAYLPEKTEAA